MKDIDTLEARFRSELVAALRGTAGGRSAALFSLSDNRASSKARRLRAQAEQIMRLRQLYSVDRDARPLAASYLLACLQQEHEGRDPGTLADGLLQELAA